MTTEATTETDAADNVDETETDSKTETTETTDETETDSEDDEEGSNVTPREKELRRLLRENEKELRRLRKTEEEARRAEMTEAEKLREENSTLATKLDSILRAKIVAEYGLDADLAERLRGVTEEELEEDAKKLAELVKPPKPKSKDVGIGALGGDETPTDPRELHKAWTKSR
jgi:hypothetical protein